MQQYESTAMEFLHTQTQLNRFIVTHFIQMKATHFQLKRSIQIFQINFIDLPKRNFIECLRCTIFFCFSLSIHVSVYFFPRSSSLYWMAKLLWWSHEMSNYAVLLGSSNRYNIVSFTCTHSPSCCNNTITHNSKRCKFHRVIQWNFLSQIPYNISLNCCNCFKCNLCDFGLFIAIL